MGSRESILNLRARSLRWPPVFALALVLGGAFGLCLAEEGDQHVFRLQHKPAGFAWNVAIEDVGEVAPFDEEPDLVPDNQNVVRGLLPTGAEEKDHTAFIWDRGKGALYVDLNHNRDLTDDPGGVFQSTRHRDNFAYFDNVRVQTPYGQQTLPYGFDLRLYALQKDFVYCAAMVRSGWQSKVTLGGREWIVSVVDNMDGRIEPGKDLLVLRAADDTLGDSTELNTLPMPKNLFMDGVCYALSAKVEPSESGPELRISFTELHLETGTLGIEGQSIKRLFLVSDDTTVILDSPPDKVAVPVGDYHWSKVFLEADDPEGVFEGHPRYPSGTEVSIHTDHPADVKVGGPLAPSVAVKRSGRMLVLNYELRGKGGELYRALGKESAPRFSIRHWGRELASGKFEYG